MICFSILIPVYNVDSYLNQCMDSVIKQTYSNLEIICIDDGSIDHSGKILDEYAKKDKRIKVIHKNNTGYGHSMNLGLSLASGDYIGIVESDDFIAPDMYEKMAAVIEKEEEQLDVVKASYYQFSNHNCVKDTIFKKAMCGHVISPKEYTELFYIPPSIWSAVYRKDFLINRDIRFSETPGASYQDTGFSFKVWITAEKIYLMEDAFSYYRVDNINSSVYSTNKLFCVCDEIEDIETYIDKHNLKNFYVENVKEWYTYKIYRWNYFRLHLGLKSAFWVKMIHKFREIANSPNFVKGYWNDESWNGIHNILDNPEKFFWDTNKQLKNLELEQYTIKNEIYQKALPNFLKEQHYIIIYGAGVYGKWVFEYLTKLKLRDKIIYFAVTSKNKNLVSEIDGIPVVNIDELLQWKEEALVIAAVSLKTQQEILWKLRSLDFNNVIRVDNEFLNLIKSI